MAGFTAAEHAGSGPLCQALLLSEHLQERQGPLERRPANFTVTPLAKDHHLVLSGCSLCYRNPIPEGSGILTNMSALGPHPKDTKVWISAFLRSLSGCQNAPLPLTQETALSPDLSLVNPTWSGTPASHTLARISPPLQLLAYTATSGSAQDPSGTPS